MSKRSLPGFTGAYQDGVTFGYGLGHGYRWHLPVLMRFNAPDSLSPFAAGGINPYAYCAGDPINHSDPTGHMFNPGEVVEAVDELAHTSRSTAQTTDALSAHPSEPDGAANRPGTSAASHAEPGATPLDWMQSSRWPPDSGYPLSFSLDITLGRSANGGYKAMTFTGYQLGIGPTFRFERPLTLFPGQSAGTPIIHTDWDVAHHYLTDHHMSLLGRLHSGIDYTLEPRNFRLHVSITAGTRRRLFFLRDLPGPLEYQVSANEWDSPYQEYRNAHVTVQRRGSPVRVDPFDWNSRPRVVLNITGLIPTLDGDEGIANAKSLVRHWARHQI